jgi:hypothetical protein
MRVCERGASKAPNLASLPLGAFALTMPARHSALCRRHRQVPAVARARLLPHRRVMRDFSYVISIIAALVSVVAAVAWLRIYRNPKNDLSAGGGGKPQSSRLKAASGLIAVAVGLMVVAALLAVIAWIRTT